MGSSQSQTARSDPPTPPSSQTNNNNSRSRPSSTSRLGSLRRLSTLGSMSMSRRSSSATAITDQNGKRTRQGSTNSSNFIPDPIDRERECDQRIETEQEQERSERSKSKKQKRQSISPSGSKSRSRSRSRSLSTTDPIGTTSTQTQTDLSEPIPYPQPTPALAIPWSASPSDPLAEERLQSLSTIREALGPDWPQDDSTSTPAVERLLHRFRRSSSFPPPVSVSPQPSSPQRTMSDRLTALLGLSTVDDEIPGTTSDADASASASTPSLPPDATLEQIQQRLDQAREELANTSRQLDEARERVQAARRRPAGAVLVIQGLAQTHTQEETSSEASDADSTLSTLTSDASRPTRLRRASESHARRSASQSQSQSSSPSPSPDSQNGSSLETQARMIGGLLTVAAAATATTLLNPEQPIPASTRSPAASALEAIMNRLRPQRRTHTVETALSNYLRTALRDNRQSTATDAAGGGTQGQANVGEAIAEADTRISTEFQQFLETLQGDLVGAVRAFAGPLPVEVDRGDEESFVTATEGSATPIAATSATSIEADVVAEPNMSEPIIPNFHHQAGQSLPSGQSTQSREVTGGTDGVPRRLNFFRAHLFPPTTNANPSTPTSAGATDATDEDAEALVPCIFIGVRSIRHDPSMTTEELVSHPSFPFVDGQVPDAVAPAQEGDANVIADTTSNLEDTSESSPTTPIRPDTPAPSTPSSPPLPRRSLRDRVMERLTHSSSSSTTRRSSNSSDRLQGPLNTYLVYVIGGNYPRSHPVLSIPNLITGGPLTDEEMTLVGELMGNVKPPTVQKEDIEKSNLKVVEGDKMKGLNEQGELLDNCVERCLICLGDYEPQEECRILNCKHGYHKTCVDQWLSTGRNSCPACRSQAVDVKAIPTSTSTPAATSNADASESDNLQTASNSNTTEGFGPTISTSTANGMNIDLDDVE